LEYIEILASASKKKRIAIIIKKEKAPFQKHTSLGKKDQKNIYPAAKYPPNEQLPLRDYHHHQKAQGLT
jgi:hypothetical protein